MAMTSQATGQAADWAELERSALEYCRSAGVAGPIEVAPEHRVTLHRAAVVCGVRTSIGVLPFYCRAEFVHSTQLVRHEIVQAGWATPAHLHVADALVADTPGSTWLVVPPVLHHDGRPAPPLAKALADSRGESELAATASSALRGFQSVRPVVISAAREAADLRSRHATSDPLTAIELRRIAAAVEGWAPVLDGMPAGMHPRDFYRNLLAGAPLGTPAALSSITLIDYGESQKHCCLADALAALAMAVLAQTELVTAREWLAEVCDQLDATPAELSAIPLFLALWLLRWALRHPRDADSIENALRLAETAEPAPDIDWNLSRISSCRPMAGTSRRS